MFAWVEDLVEGIRRDLGLTGFPKRWNLGEMLHSLRDWVQVHYDDCQTAACYSRPDGPAAAFIPKDLAGFEHDETVCEEAGHGRLTNGLGNLLLQLDPDNPNVERLARIWRGHDERLARAFVMAWFLPASLCRQYTAPEVLEVTGYPMEFIQERYRDLQEDDRQRVFSAHADFRFRQAVARADELLRAREQTRLQAEAEAREWRRWWG